MSASRTTQTSAPIIELKGITKHFRRKPTLAERILMATGRGKAPPVLRAVDGIDLRRQREAPAARDLAQADPERILEADAGLVTCDDDGAFDDRRLHAGVSLSMRCWSRRLAARCV